MIKRDGNGGQSELRRGKGGALPDGAVSRPQGRDRTGQGERLNVYEMICACERNIEDDALYPLFIKRDSWDDPRTVLEVLGTDPDWKSWCDRAEPYFGNPRVYGWLFAKGAYKLIEVSCPGTYAYKRVEQPAWWFPPAEGTLRLSSGMRVELLA